MGKSVFFNYLVYNPLQSFFACFVIIAIYFAHKGFAMIRIISDTTSCIPVEEARQLGIGYVPQIIVFGEESYRDDSEMDARTFVKRLPNSPVLPKTAAPPPALYHPIYCEGAKQGDTMIVIAPSADVSGTVRGATVAAEEVRQEYPEVDIRIVDTRLVSSGMGSVVQQAVKWVNEGLNADSIVEKIKEMSRRERCYFVVDTLEYLYKGGRIGAAKALMGSLLQMKPILTFRDGQTQAFENQRTHKRGIARLKEIVLSDCPRHPDAHLSLMHGDAEDEARQLAQEFSMLLEIPVEQIPIRDLTPAILVHAGPGIIGASYFITP